MPLINDQSLKDIANKTYQLRRALTSKKFTETFLDKLRDKQGMRNEWVSCTAFLNAICEGNFLQGNFFAGKLRSLHEVLTEDQIAFEESFSKQAQNNLMTNLKEEGALQTAANFYTGYDKLFNDAHYWHKLCFHIIKRFLKDNDIKLTEEKEKKLVEITNQTNLNDASFRSELIYILKDIKNAPHHKINELFKLKELWQEMTFLAYLNTSDFIKAHEAFLDEKKIFAEIKASSLKDKEIKEYLLQFELYLDQVEEAFVFAMHARAKLKSQNKTGIFLNPLFYIYEELSSGKILFDEPLALITYENDEREMLVLQADTEEEAETIIQRQASRSHLPFFCYVNNANNLYLIRSNKNKLKIACNDDIAKVIGKEKENNLSLDKILQLQNQFFDLKHLTSSERTQRELVLLKIPTIQEEVTDEQFNYFNQTICNYLEANAKKLVNINDFFNNNSALIRKFKLFAKKTKWALQEVFDENNTFYSFDFIYSVVREHEKVFMKKLGLQVLKKIKLKELQETNQASERIEQLTVTPNIKIWLRSHINCYFLIATLENEIQSYRIDKETKRLTKIREKLNRLKETYFEKENGEIKAYLQTKLDEFKQNYLILKEKEYQNNIAFFIRKAHSAYLANTIALKNLIQLLKSQCLQYEAFLIENNLDKESVWKFSYNEAVKSYQEISKNEGIQDTYFLLYIKNRMRSELNNEEYNDRVKFHIEQNNDSLTNINLMQQIIEDKIGIDYSAAKSILFKQAIVAKTAHTYEYQVPKELQHLLQGNDLDGRVEFLKEKNSKFAAIDQAFKASEILLNNAFVGLASDSFLEALNFVKSGISLLEKEQGEEINMDFFAKEFFHKKTWVIKNEWKQTASHYHQMLKQNYGNILNKIKQAFLKELRNGNFNFKLYEVYQEAVNSGKIIPDNHIENEVIDHVLNFPFILTNVGEINYKTASVEYLNKMLNLAYAKLTKKEISEWIHLLLDKVLQGLIENHAGVRNENTIFNTSLIKTSEELKKEQIKNIISFFSQEINKGNLQLDFANSSLNNDLHEYLFDDKRLQESSTNQTLEILASYLALDGNFYKNDLNQLTILVAKKKRNNEIITNAKELADKVICNITPDLIKEINFNLANLPDEDGKLFSQVYHGILTSHLKYLIDLSYQAETENLNKTLLKEQIWAILDGNFIFSDEKRLVIFQFICKEILKQNTLDFFDKKILVKMAQLKLSLKDLAIDLNLLISVIEKAPATLRNYYLDLATNDASEIATNFINKDNLSPVEEMIFSYHLGRLTFQQFTQYYLHQSYNEKIAALVEAGQNDSFKEAYRFKEFLSVLDIPTKENCERFSKKLKELTNNNIKLADYFGSDNLNLLVEKLYELYLKFDLSFKRSVVESQQDISREIDILILFDDFMDELKDLPVIGTDYLFCDIIKKIKEDLHAIGLAKPLLKAWQNIFESPFNIKKSLSLLKSYLQEVNFDDKKKVTMLPETTINLFFLLKQKLFGKEEENHELNFMPNGAIQKDESSLTKVNIISEAAYWNYFSLPALNYLDGKLNEMKTMDPAAALYILYILREENLTALLKGNVTTNKLFQDKILNLTNQFNVLFREKFKELINLKEINSESFHYISDWLVSEFSSLNLKLKQTEIMNLNYYSDLIDFYLANQNKLSSEANQTIMAFLQDNDQVVKQKILPNLHPNSSLFLAQANDNNEMQSKINREQFYQSISLRALLYQKFHPDSQEFKNGLRAVKSAYIARGISDEKSLARFDKINKYRTAGFVFRYNAFEAFTKEPLNKLFFEENTSSLISFLGSYRNAKTKENDNKWKDELLNLYTNETLLHKLISLTHAFLYETKLHVSNHGASADVIADYDKKMSELLDLYNHNDDDVLKKINVLFLQIEQLIFKCDFFSEEDKISRSLSQYYRLLFNLNRIHDTIDQHSTPIQQKIFFIAFLLRLSYEEGNASIYLNLAYDEIKALSVKEPLLDLTILPNKMRQFLIKICPGDYVDNKLPFNSLSDIIYNTLNPPQASLEANNLYLLVKQLERDLFYYFLDQLKSGKEKLYSRRDLASTSLTQDNFKDLNSYNKYLIAEKVLKYLKHEVFTYGFFQNNKCNNLDKAIVNCLEDAKKEIALKNIRSNTFTDILVACEDLVMKETQQHTKVLRV